MSHWLICDKIESMLGIIEKNAILVASLVAFLISYRKNTTGFDISVLVFLISLILTEASIYLKNKKRKRAVLGVYVVLCIIQWRFAFFLPVAIFAIMEEGLYYGFFILCLYLPLYFQNDSVSVICTQLMLCMLSGFLAYENTKAGMYRKMYLETRDSSAELENRLKQKNRELLESQDASISIATLKERNRIAREIHDNVGHMLSRTILQTGALLTIYKEEPLHGQMQSINASLNEAMNNIRESVHDLHDESVDLKLSISEVLKPLHDRYVIVFDYDMSDKVSRNIKYCFISIIKEATANIVKHSSASKIYLLLREHPGFYQLAIEDNGKEKIEIEHAGIGLTNMRDRVESLSGNISFSDSNGFKILVSIPKNQGE